MRVLITGGNGLLGQALTRLLLSETGHELIVTDLNHRPVFNESRIKYSVLDVTVKKDVRDHIQGYKPEVIVNLAANTDVDDCEKDREKAHLINVKAVEHLTEYVRVTGAHIIHLSTDYIFDGERAPLDELAAPSPVNYYGRTKLASENLVRGAGIRHTIVRSMILYGYGKGIKPNFALWVINNLKANKKINVFIDQYGQPTFSDDLAYGILRIIELKRTGVYNISGHEVVSRYDFAAAVAETFKLNKSLIQPVTSDEFRLDAPRPRYSEFVTHKALMELGIRPLKVREGLHVLRRQMEQDPESGV